ncbi:hypothetical protein ACGC1H_000059 [Rhizoctonia solani]
MSATISSKKGSLTIAGSGIASIAHITLEALSHIKSADKIFYLVCDPATESFIQDNAQGKCFDLHVFYGKTKARYDSYVQMSEVMLREVRSGHNVLGVFYGHPGLFVSPSHRAIAIAREEGYNARLLPGVSAEDYLFADLEVDPATCGCVAYEATDLLVRNKPLSVVSHNVIWQVGAVGIANMDFDNSGFGLLVNKLEETFGGDHQVVHYIGAVLPQSATIKTVLRISDLRKAEVAQAFNPSSTLYIPPLRQRAVDQDVLDKLRITGNVVHSSNLYPGPKWAGAEYSTAPAYGPHEKHVISAIDTHTPPADHQILHASAAMKKAMQQLALDRNLLERYKADPQAYANTVEGLTNAEKFALSQDKPGSIHAVMKATPANIAAGHELSAEAISAASASNADTTVIIILVFPL